MPLIYVVRHGRVDSAHPTKLDPPLDALGRQQAEAVAKQLDARLGRPLPIISSPLTRCLETAAPLARLWGAELVIEDRIRELPTPESLSIARSKWINEVIRMRWAEVARSTEAMSPGYTARLAAWRAGLRQALLNCRVDTVAYSHFVAINGMAVEGGDEAPVSTLNPGHTSISLFETDGLDVHFVGIEDQRQDGPVH